MRLTRYVLGGLAVVTALAVARDTAGSVAVAGTPAPLSVESMRALVADSCQRPPGFRPSVLQRLDGWVLEVGVTDTHLVMCIVGEPRMWSHSTVDAGLPGAEYFTGRTGLVQPDRIVAVGRVAPEVAVLEIELPGGQVVKADLHGEVFLCDVPLGTTKVRVRAYDAGGRLLREADM